MPPVQAKGRPPHREQRPHGRPRGVLALGPEERRAPMKKLRSWLIRTTILLLIGAAVGAWLSSGAWLGSSPLDEVVATRVRRDLGASVLVGNPGVDGGALLGLQWPGRLVGRAVVGSSVARPLRLELRAGANLVAERSPEPAAELLLGIELR